MRRLPTMLASASAAALSALAITVAVPAIADNAGEAKLVRYPWLVPAAYAGAIALFLASYYLVHAAVYGVSAAT